MTIDARILDQPIALLNDQLSSGALRVAEIADAVMKRLRAEDGSGPYAWLDTAFVARQAGVLDGWRGRGRAIGSLHGIPIGLADTIDTAAIPTRNGTPIDEGRVPEADSVIMESLRKAGALLVGKTATSEFRSGAMRPTRNRGAFDRAAPEGFVHRTRPVGNAASAIRNGTILGAVDVETDGTLIRQAAEGGVVGYKPSLGSISRRGVLSLSSSLDTPGVLARTVEDAALLADALFDPDRGDSAMIPVPPARLTQTASTEPPVKPLFAFVRTAAWNEAHADVQAALEELADHLGDRCFQTELPPIFEEAPIHFQRVVEAEMARGLAGLRNRAEASLSDSLRSTLDRGNQIRAFDYLAAKDWQAVFRAGAMTILDRCDAILTPAAAVPGGLVIAGKPGSGALSRLWTFCGLPCVSLPLFADADGRPMGAQLVGRFGEDARLLRTARWLERHILTGDTA